MATPYSQLDFGKRIAILGAVMTGLFLSAMDQTIVGTALPRIIADLAGLDLYAWVFTSYMLASTTLVPIIGKLGDVYGRKRFFLAGVVIFLAGSMLCGTSQSMVQLIVFRGLQGVGGAFIFANAFAIVGDLFPPAERGRYAGIMSSVFGLASVIGPLIGGAITDHLDWRWVFYVNLPIGIAAFAVLAYVLPQSERHAAPKPIDFAGAVVMVGAIAPLLLGFSWAGTEYAWRSPQVAGCFAVSAVCASAFLWVESHAADPIVPLSLFRNPIFAVCTATTLVSGAGMFAGSVYIPLFMQGVLDFSATNAGLVLTPMTLGMVGASTASGYLISHNGRYKWNAVAGMAIATAGLVMLAQMDEHSSQVNGMAYMAVVGAGLGLSFPALVLASQNSVSHAMMGVTTSLNQFARSVGGTIGVAVMGSILTRRLDEELATNLPLEVQQRAPAQLVEQLKEPRLLLDDGALAALREQGFGSVFGADGPRLFDASIASMQSSLATAIGEVFVVAAGIMLVATMISLFLREVPLRRTYEMPEREGAPAGAPGTSGQGGT